MQCDYYDLFCVFSWWIEEIKLLFIHFIDLIFSGFASMAEAIPVPGFLLNNTLTLPSGILYFLDVFQLQYGLSVIVAAYVARFSLRRLPGIG